MRPPCARGRRYRARINLDNSEISLRGIKNALKPSLDLTASATNNGLAGTLNPNLINLPGTPLPDQYFVGGLSTVFGQLFRRNFPDYGVRLTLSVPLKNRQAQADMTRETLRRRRQDIQLRQQENAIKLEVSRAAATLDQEHENYRIAVEARELREQMAEAERKRLSLGSSTIFAIIQAQRDLSAARTAEVNAARAYTNARINMERVTGRTLRANSISISEAYAGEVAKAPDPIPPALLERP
ncbi:MAG: TolC family protein [Bryobacterales bacterium]